MQAEGRSGTWALLLTTLLGGGCNTLLGVSDAERDADGDLIDVADDNCPAIGNPDQADGDGDGLGDACDACAGCGDGSFSPFDADLTCSTGHDEDGDGQVDACDPCPIGPGAANVDDDGDGVGGGCDPNPGLADTLLFDPQIRVGGIGWSGGGWALGGDADSVVATRGTLASLIYGQTVALAPSWYVETRWLSLPSTSGDDVRLGTRDGGIPPKERVTCQLERRAAAYVLTVGADGEYAASAPVELVVPQVLRIGQDAGVAWCEYEAVATGRARVTVPGLIAEVPVSIQVSAQADVALAWLLFAGRRP